jgi:hypothetical protein
MFQKCIRYTVAHAVDTGIPHASNGERGVEKHLFPENDEHLSA